MRRVARAVVLFVVVCLAACATPLEADSVARPTSADRNTMPSAAPPGEALRLASLLQPPEPRQPPDPRQPADDPARDDLLPPSAPPAVLPESEDVRRQFVASLLKLRRAPAMFGDFFSAGTFEVFADDMMIETDIALAGGNRRVKVAEHNKPLTDDRVYLLVNHFHNALEAVSDWPGFSRSFDVNRYTIGMEKTFANGLSSVEVRMPFTAGADIYVPDPFAPASNAFTARSGHIGDLAVVLKCMLYQDEFRSVAAGLGVNVPTGSNVDAFVSLPATTYLVRNQAVNLLPYVGYMSAPNERFFYQAFAQLDFAVNGHEVRATRHGVGTVSGMLNEQTLLYLDVSAGYWLCSRPDRRWLTGVAALLELHYTLALQDADTFTAFGTFGNAANRFDILNLTAGFHVQLTEATDLRVGGVLPIREAYDRSFDGEVSVALIRHF